jgi:hypothetical protein
MVYICRSQGAGQAAALKDASHILEQGIKNVSTASSSYARLFGYKSQIYADTKNWVLILSNPERKKNN